MLQVHKVNGMDALSQVKELLGQSIKCTLQDGRTISGTLIAFDREKNIVLRDALEIRSVPSNIYISQRSATMINDDNLSKMINVADVVSLERKLSEALVPGNKVEKVELR